MVKMTLNNATAHIFRVRVKVKLAHSHSCPSLTVTDKDSDQVSHMVTQKNDKFENLILRLLCVNVHSMRTLPKYQEQTSSYRESGM